jgi:HD superfamily phosphohydrolase
MEFSGLETIVIDLLRTPELRRLSRIRQTGLASLVFPGAEHSRLAHALGSAFLAMRFVRQLEEATGFLSDILRPTPEAVRDLGVAALCHDIGHGPFSHAWEREVVGHEYQHDRWAEALGVAPETEILRGLKWHELAGQALLAWGDGQLHQLLEQHESESSTRVRMLLRGDYFPEYLPRLLSSDVDVDRADYLLRDAHACGVGYGRYDLNWLVSTCTVGQTHDGRYVVGFDARKAPRVVEQFLIARAAMYDTVYSHKTVRSVESMMGQLLRRLRDKGMPFTDSARLQLFEPYRRMLDGGTVGCPELLRLDDHSLLMLIEAIANEGHGDVVAVDLAQRIVRRELFKVVPLPPQRVVEIAADEDTMDRIRHAVQRFCPGDPAYYVHVDRESFEMFSRADSHVGYFVDQDGHASSIRSHPLLERQFQEVRLNWRLYTVAEAREAVLKVCGA